METLFFAKGMAMKRLLTLLLLLLLTLLLLLLLPLIALAETPLFTEGEPHKSHLDYRQYFMTMTSTAGECTLYIAADVYDPALAESVYAHLAADEAVLANLLPLRPHAVYVVKKPLAGMQCSGQNVYCTAAQVLDGSYRTWLVTAALGAERWQAAGLAGHAFREQADETSLAAWYADAAHDDMLSLFPAYFMEAFASEDEMHMAEQTALSVTEYIIRNRGTEAVLTADLAEDVPAWLASIGATRAYADPYAGLLADYTYTHNQFYPLIATSPRGDVFKLTPLEYDMTTPARVRMALCELEKGVDAILEGVKWDAPDWYDRLAANYAAPITYEFNGDSPNSVTHLAARRVEVGAAFSLIHETAHIMAPCVYDRISRYTDYWKAEAIAQYLSLTYYPGLIRQADDWRYFQEEVLLALDDEEERAFYERLRYNYLFHAPWPDAPQDVNEKLYWRLAALTKKELGMDGYSVSKTYSSVGSTTMDAVNGNELSYAESEWFASWLVGRHGLSAFLHYCMDEGVPFEDAFGVPYQNAKADWLKYRSILE